MQTMVSTAGDQSPMALEMAIDAPDALMPGSKAGPWIVERELGRGGMGAVYAVVHEEIGKRAALKLMHRRLVVGSSAERILLEARVVNQVGHPNIVDIFETGALADGRPYIVMERLEGVPLSQRADEGKILPDQVIAILLQVCDALIAAHAAGVIHRDLKLDNVFLIDNPDDPTTPRVKLLDWGIAKVISAEPRHTIEGQLVGTPQYLAPEQARGAAVSPQTDVYSLGVMAYELFLEQLPFEAETSAEIMAMHLRAAPPPPHEAWPDIPRDLEALLLAMLAKDPQARPGMLSVARALEQVHGDMIRRKRTVITDQTAAVVPPVEPTRATRWSSAPGLAPTEPAMWRRRGRRWQFAIGALALASSAAMFLLTRDGDSAAATAPVPAAEAAQVTASEPAAPPPAAIAPNQAPAPADTQLVSATPAVATAVITKIVPPRPRHGRVAHKVPATPRRTLALDPDGTIDPYQ